MGVVHVVIESVCGCHNNAHYAFESDGCEDPSIGETQHSSHLVEEWVKTIWTMIRMRNRWLHFEGVFVKHRVRTIDTKGVSCYFLPYCCSNDSYESDRR